MDIRKLVVTQDCFRRPSQIPHMVDFVKKGGEFKPLEIARFPSGLCFIHNGHHRAASLFIAGRFHLKDKEIEIVDWEYSDYEDIVFTKDNGEWVGYVTPFKILMETRLSDFRKFKEHVSWLYWNQSPQHARHYILTNPSKYKQPRKHYHIEDLVENTYEQA